MNSPDVSKAPSWATHLAVHRSCGDFWFVNWDSRRWTTSSTYEEYPERMGEHARGYLNERCDIIELHPAIEENE